MTVITQGNMDFAQNKLRKIIKLANSAHDELCALGLTDQRDTVALGLSHLWAAESVMGQLSIPVADGEVSTRSGDK